MGSRFGGSRFNILNEFDSADVTPGNIPESGKPNGVVIPANNHSLVENSTLGIVCGVVTRSTVNVASDVSRQTSSRVVLNEVIVNENVPITVVYSEGSQIPKVISHEVHNVAGNHVAVSILDAANEQRRQRLATMGAKQGVVRRGIGTGADVQPPIVDPMVQVETTVNSSSRLGNASAGIHRN
ncbi:hypothetical protein V6N13_113904 [Hibiscus sabdariffa]|uniref:Uncharacterized protein n=1 Tax=Hibiscus sabdariffa TaxID=183260 RepID=A0ABR2U0G1_9ROSI